eukprot:GABV01002553.1.p1 GENE.GABV01002553.1~~GABV01002553.1.p1  ORF type:complete len:226 (+),score=49.55 GABV01002553.1:73-678(+)
MMSSGSSSNLTPSQPVEMSLKRAVEISENGGIFRKFHYTGRGRPKRRFVYVLDAATPEARVLYGDPEKRHRPDKFKSMLLKNVHSVQIGKRTAALKAYKEAQARFCFSIVASGRTLDLQAESTEQRDLWVGAITKLLEQPAIHSRSVGAKVEQRRGSLRIDPRALLASLPAVLEGDHEDSPSAGSTGGSGRHFTFQNSTEY